MYFLYSLLKWGKEMEDTETKKSQEELETILNKMFNPEQKIVTLIIPKVKK